MGWWGTGPADMKQVRPGRPGEGATGMKVKVASSRGFCFGVEDAIQIAEAAVKERGRGKVIALGPVIHNEQVVQKLEKAGLNQSGDLETINPAQAVLIRSH